MTLFSDCYAVFSARFYQPSAEDAPRFAELERAGFIGAEQCGKLQGYGIRKAGYEVVQNAMRDGVTQ